MFIVLRVYYTVKKTKYCHDAPKGFKVTLQLD